MKRVKSPAGYTIVETLIFLAVSAMLFVSASYLISGRQRKTQFATTVRDFSSKLQSVYGNVDSGYYNSTGKVTCTTNAAGISTLATNGNDQGTNGSCIFLGQVLVSPSSGGDFKIVSLVGVRTTGSPPSEVSKLSDAKPRLFIDTAETYSLAGADFVSVKDGTNTIGTSVDPSGKNASSSVAFISSFAGYSSGLLNTGSSHTDVFGVNSNQTNQGGGIETTLGSSATPPSPIKGELNYCITNGEQSAIITLKGGSTSYVIGDTSICTR